MKTYRRFPPEPPSGHRTVWLLIGLTAAALVANLAHQAGIG